MGSREVRCVPASARLNSRDLCIIWVPMGLALVLVGPTKVKSTTRGTTCWNSLHAVDAAEHSKIVCKKRRCARWSCHATWHWTLLHVENLSGK